MEKKKLIEVALPLEKINKEAIAERYSHSGHPFQLHMWWARRPLATTAAVIWSSLVDDPSSHPEQFPTEEEQTAERQRLFKILGDLVAWENSNNDEILAAAKAEIMKSTGGNPPALLDPFAGGGAIPLEAQRLGLEAHASDLNPVAVMINKAMIEIPPRFAGQAPVNPEARAKLDSAFGWKGAQGLAEDVRYYGEWMKREAFKRIGHLFPKVKVPKKQGGGEATVVAWIWVRTVKCPNPACGCEMPLASSFILSNKKGKETWVKPILEGSVVRFEVQKGKCPKEYESSKVGRSAIFKCLCCGEITTDAYVKQNGKEHKIGAQLMAISAEGNRGRMYLSPDSDQIVAANIDKPERSPDGAMPINPRWFSPPAFGMTEYSDLFTPRQLTTLVTFSDLLPEAQRKVNEDAASAGKLNDYVKLADGGSGATAYGEAVIVYLSFVIDKIADYNSSLCHWQPGGDKAANTYSRQAIPMVWDFAEANPFANAYGGWSNKLSWTQEGVNNLPAMTQGMARQFDAQSDNGLRNIVVSTDPPYYDNIGYADLSDFFYIWLRQGLKDVFPKLFKTMLVPKAEELVATPYHFDGSKEAAKSHFESGMFSACCQFYKYAHESIPVTIYYAFKQSETETDGEEVSSASSGWETMLSAIINAGFSITGTWPIRTELANRSIAIGTNALATSIVLVCRKRPENAPTATRRTLINELKRELKPALQKLQRSNIAPVDLAQSAIGPGIGIYSRFSKVLEADGTPMSVRSALQIINQELDHYFTEQDDELDRDSRFCVDLYSQYAFNDMKFGEADVLARAKNTSVEKLRGAGILYAEKGVVRLLTREDISMTPASRTKSRLDDGITWLLTQQLTHALETDGVNGAAKIVADIFTSEPEHAKALAYRLFQIAERKGWAGEAYAYNSLVIAWPDVQSKAADIQAAYNNAKQMTIFDFNND